MTENIGTDITSEVDKRLDRECEFTFTWDDNVFSLSRRYNLVALGTFLRTEHEIDIYYFLKDVPSRIQEMRNALILLNAENIGENWVIKQPITASKFLDAINGILKIPSIVLDMTMMRNGKLHLRFRFHHSVDSMVSDYIIAQLSGSMDFSVHYLGKSRGFVNTVGEISEILPLASVKYSVVAPEHEKQPSKNPIGMKWERVRKYVRGDPVLHYVYYGFSEPPEESRKNLYVISDEDHLYETITGNEVITFINENSEKNRLMRVGAMHFFNGTSLEINVIIARSSVRTYLRVLSEARQKYPEWKLELTGIY
ncbi:MAG: hypothetical protein ACP5NK_01020 [Thermoplasmata archaeon]